MKMKKWMKYSCIFAFIPTVTVPVVALSSCGGDKEDKKDGDGKESTPSKEKPATTPNAGEKKSVNLPILKQNATLKGDVDLNKYVDEFNTHEDAEWKASVAGRVIENINEIENDGKIEKLVLSRIENVDDGFTLKIFLKDEFDFVEIKKNVWESTKINYIHNKKDAPKEAPKSDAPKQQPAPKTDEKPETKAVPSTGQPSPVVNSFSHQVDVDSVLKTQTA